jgi:hypothetical protein
VKKLCVEKNYPIIGRGVKNACPFPIVPSGHSQTGPGVHKSAPNTKSGIVVKPTF